MVLCILLDWILGIEKETQSLLYLDSLAVFFATRDCYSAPLLPLSKILTKALQVQLSPKMLRSTRALRSIPSASAAASSSRVTLTPSCTQVRQKSSTSSAPSSSARSGVHTSSAQNAPHPASRERGITLEAKARVREHVRRIQSSARTDAAPAVRPNPAPQFQVPATSQPPSHPNFENPLKVDSQVRNGLDHSYVDPV